MQSRTKFGRTASTLLMVSFVAVAAVGCSDDGPTANDIAREACDLARRVEQGQGNVVSVVLEGNEIRKKASANNISFSDVLSAAQRECPDVIGNLGF